MKDSYDSKQWFMFEQHIFIDPSSSSFFGWVTESPIRVNLHSRSCLVVKVYLRHNIRATEVPHEVTISILRWGIIPILCQPIEVLKQYVPIYTPNNFHVYGIMDMICSSKCMNVKCDVKSLGNIWHHFFLSIPTNQLVVDFRGFGARWFGSLIGCP